ncbi:Rne/Rng family ribonuclease [Actinotalea sp. M2MS4P-6]|uniref:Rne/Rng family ribonuclease n=1 Tax=Actinotalea sp. M2MS4P-6 TaxID=2983762 RepID=UPI0021E3FE10|nr:Rne/Rng family ribonuclease [Actinotalea sp. M2MS4P-6]MCV2393970.1 Rne/Rng family ribonuclease [Actinotalea sp. M2MS4P-6]
MTPPQDAVPSEPVDEPSAAADASADGSPVEAQAADQLQGEESDAQVEADSAAEEEPTADEVPAVEEPAEEPAVEEPAADAVAAEEPAPRSRRRRKPSAAAEEAPVAPEEPAAAEPAEAEPEAEAAKPAKKGAKSTRTTKSRKKKEAPAPEPEAAGDAEQGGEPEPEAAPETPAPRRKRSRSKAATDEAGSGDATELDVLAELGARSATALLFQAPEPTRSRRAQAPAGAPTSGEPDDEAAEGDAPETQADDEIETEGTEGQGDEEQTEDGREGSRRRRRRRGGRGRRRSGAADQDDQGGSEPADESGEAGDDDQPESDDEQGEESKDGSRRRRRRRRSSGRGEPERRSDEVTALKGSTRLEAKRQRRREGRDAGRRRAVITEAEFLARRESVERTMIVREAGGRVQIAVLEDGVLVEHFVSRAGDGHSSPTMIGNVYLGRVQNVLPSMEAAFVDIGKGRNAVLYAGEVNWDAAGLEGQPRRIEQALKSGDSVLVQVTKDPIGHKGARLTSQVTLAGRYLVYVPAGGMTGISRKLPENERARLKKLLREIVPDGAGVIVRTAAEGASEDELRRDVKRLQDQWAAIEKKQATASAPALLQGEPDLAIRVVRDIFNDDFSSLVVQGDGVWRLIREYVDAMAPDLADRVSRWTADGDAFAEHRIDEQLSKAMDRKVWLPSGGSLVIDRTEAMTVIDVNTGKFTGTGGTLEETVTRNNLEAAEEIVRQLRLRDIGGIIVIDFIDMVLESNRDLVLRRLVECLGRDRTKHQVAEVTSLGLVQMTRKRVGQGLVEAFSETCQHCSGRGYLIRSEPVDGRGGEQPDAGAEPKRSRRGKRQPAAPSPAVPVLPEAREAVKATLATIAAAAAHAHEHDHEPGADAEPLDVEALEAAGLDAETLDVVEPAVDVETEVVEVVEVVEIELDAVDPDPALADEATPSEAGEAEEVPEPSEG